MIKMEFNPGSEELQKVLYHYGVENDNMIACPFHDDNKPSMGLNLDDGVFHCFACGVSGNAFDFVKYANPKINGINQLKLYYSILNSDKVRKIKIDKKSKESKKSKLRKRKQKIKESFDYYYGLKKVNWENEENVYKDYMLKRGFSSKALNLCKAKLTIVNKAYPLIFPIFDNDEFRGYVCRTTSKRIEERAKYLYNEGFSRVDTLGGNYKSKIVVVCEGYMDALKLKQFGLKNVVAIFGWKITQEQINKLKVNGVEIIIDALDMDEPGRKGAEVLKKYFKVIPFIFPDNVVDPGDLNLEQFNLAYSKTKKMLYRRKKNVYLKQDKKRCKK